jgi:hypothetical protein
MPALAAWIPSPAPGAQYDGAVRDPGHFHLRLADANRLDEDGVAARRIEDSEGLARRRGQTAEVAARRHRSDEDLWIQRVLLHPDPVAEQGAAGEGRARIDGQDVTRSPAAATPPAER